MKTSQPDRLSHWLWLMALATSGVFAQQTDAGEEAAVYLLSEDVLAQMKPHLAPMSVAALPPLSSVQTIWARGNFGKSFTVESNFRATRLESGLYRIEQRASSRTAFSASASTGSALLLCGLTTMMAASESSTTHSSMLPVAGTGLFFEAKSTVNGSGRSRAIRLTSTSPSLCNIAPGDTFEFTVERESETRTEGVFVRDKTTHQTGIGTLSCAAAPGAEPAQRIAPFLTGEAIAVSCETVDAKKRPITVRYMHLVDYRYYLPVANTSHGVRSETAYSSGE